jgi:hypothetical protein
MRENAGIKNAFLSIPLFMHVTRSRRSSAMHRTPDVTGSIYCVSHHAAIPHYIRIYVTPVFMRLATIA